jgi:predicted nucleotidyltransferase
VPSQLNRHEPALRDFFQRRAGEVAAAYVFGSQARGTAHAGSDFDLAVLLREAPPRTLEGLSLDMAAELERTLAVPVDLVVLNRAPPDLIHRVMRDGRIIMDLDRGARIAFEVRARNEYFDVLPTLERYRRIQPGPR